MSRISGGRTPHGTLREASLQEKLGTTSESSIDEVLLGSIYSALSVLGDTVRDSILHFEKSRYSISEDEIPRKADEFMKGLRDLLGYGGRVVEKLAKQKFAERFHLVSNQIAGKSLGELANLVRQSSLQQ